MREEIKDLNDEQKEKIKKEVFQTPKPKLGMAYKRGGAIDPRLSKLVGGGIVMNSLATG